MLLASHLQYGLQCTVACFFTQGFMSCICQAGARVIAAVEGHSDQASADAVNGSRHGINLLESLEIARLGTGLQVINQSLRGGEGICVAPMRPTLLRMLPSLLRVQVGT